MTTEIREIMFLKGILAVFHDICLKANFSKDIETYLRFLNMTKQVVKYNKLLNESKETNLWIYPFVISHFDTLQKEVIYFYIY